MLCLPVASKVRNPIFMNLGLSPMIKFVRFTRMFGSKSVTVLSGRLFTPTFSNAREVLIPFLGCRSVNGSVQWINVPRPFDDTGIATAAWTENLYVYPWGTNPNRSPNVPINRRATFPNVPINLRTVARRLIGTFGLLLGLVPQG